MAIANRETILRRLTDATNGAFDVAAVYIGLRLGLYRAIADNGRATPAELAARTSTNERMVREWLEQQAATELLLAENVDGAWRFELPADLAAVLLDPDAVDGMGATVRGQIGALVALPRIVDSFRTGQGVAYAEYGADMSEGEASSTAPVYRRELTTWIDAVPGLVARLEAGGTVLDVGCGFGGSSIALARTFPRAHVDGIDRDEYSIAGAIAQARELGIDDRVRFETRNATSLAGSAYDAALMLEMLHDLAHPVEVLRAVRGALAPHGVVIVADELTADAFTGPADERDRRHYGWSILVCLPAAMTEPDSAATGAVIRPSTVAAYAREAGFSRTEILPIDSDAFRIYAIWL